MDTFYKFKAKYRETPQKITNIEHKFKLFLGNKKIGCLCGYEHNIFISSHFLGFRIRYWRIRQSSSIRKTMLAHAGGHY